MRGHGNDGVLFDRTPSRAKPIAQIFGGFAPLPQSSVPGAAARMVLDGDARRVVEGIPEPRITGETSRDDTAPTEALTGRCGATRIRKAVIVSWLHGFSSLCGQRGEDDPTVFCQGCKDRSVALLVHLSRFAFPLARIEFPVRG